MQSASANPEAEGENGDVELRPLFDADTSCCEGVCDSLNGEKQVLRRRSRRNPVSVGYPAQIRQLAIETSFAPANRSCKGITT